MDDGGVFGGLGYRPAGEMEDRVGFGVVSEQPSAGRVISITEISEKTPPRESWATLASIVASATAPDQQLILEEGAAAMEVAAEATKQPTSFTTQPNPTVTATVAASAPNPAAAAAANPMSPTSMAAMAKLTSVAAVAAPPKPEAPGTWHPTHAAGLKPIVEDRSMRSLYAEASKQSLLAASTDGSAAALDPGSTAADATGTTEDIAGAK